MLPSQWSSAGEASFSHTQWRLSIGEKEKKKISFEEEHGHE